LLDSKLIKQDIWHHSSFSSLHDISYPSFKRLHSLRENCSSLCCLLVSSRINVWSYKRLISFLFLILFDEIPYVQLCLTFNFLYYQLLFDLWNVNLNDLVDFYIFEILISFFESFLDLFSMLMLILPSLKYDYVFLALPISLILFDLMF